MAQMLEAGVPVVYGYIEDAHDNHNQFPGIQFPNCPSNPDGTFGPGEAAYVCQLQAYETAFSKFFARLATDGINPSNTLFVITADENDHFSGSVAGAVPPDCDGVHVPCTYPTGTKGEVDADLSLVYATEFNNTTPFSVHSDDAPTFHINGDPADRSADADPGAASRQTGGIRSDRQRRPERFAGAGRSCGAFAAPHGDP
jgi:hypothetical protein